MNDELLLAKEVAKLFGVSPKTVSRWTLDGKLPSIRTPGDQPRYRKSEIVKRLT